MGIGNHHRPLPPPLFIGSGGGGRGRAGESPCPLFDGVCRRAGGGSAAQRTGGDEKRGRTGRDGVLLAHNAYETPHTTASPRGRGGGGGGAGLSRDIIAFLTL